MLKFKLKHILLLTAFLISTSYSDTFFTRPLDSCDSLSIARGLIIPLTLEFSPMLIGTGLGLYYDLTADSSTSLVLSFTGCALGLSVGIPAGTIIHKPEDYFGWLSLGVGLACFTSSVILWDKYESKASISLFAIYTTVRVVDIIKVIRNYKKWRKR